GGILLARSLQRTRASTEAMYLLAHHVFDSLGYRRYEWKCDSLNEPSRVAAARLGFTYEGRFRNAVVDKGRHRDTDSFPTPVAELVGLTRSGPAICFGLVERRAGVELPWITQVTAARGEILSVHRKAYLGEDEDPYFAPGPPTEAFELAGVTVSMAVCAEIGD